MGASKIIIASRNEQAAKKAIDEIKEQTKASTEIDFIKLDLASLESTRAFAKEILDRDFKIDYLINNAGASLDPGVAEDSKIEITFQVNHLSHFLLSNLLFDKLAEHNSVVINVSSNMHFRINELFYDEVKTDPSQIGGINGYSHSKLCNVLFTKGLQKRFKQAGSKAVSVSLCPGFVQTELGNSSSSWLTTFVKYAMRPVLGKSQSQGAMTTLHCMTTKDLNPGAYYSECAEIEPNKIALDDDAVERLWNVSEKYAGLKQ
jgi:NAD(P)-dependent dehydrogenase (short-subunit alcohol dehydrogenase family)